jgi:hypothetical protein
MPQIPKTFTNPVSLKDIVKNSANDLMKAAGKPVHISIGKHEKNFLVSAQHAGGIAAHTLHPTASSALMQVKKHLGGM